MIWTEKVSSLVLESEEDAIYFNIHGENIKGREALLDRRAELEIEELRAWAAVGRANEEIIRFMDSVRPVARLMFGATDRKAA